MSHQLTLKISLSEEIRRVQIHSDITFENLEKLVRKLFGKIGNEHLLFKYHDDEGDSITVSSNEELSEAISSKKESSLLRFYLFSSPKNKNFEKEKPTNENPPCFFFANLHCNQEKWHSLHNQAMKLFKNGSKENLEQAKEILKIQTEISPEHHKKIPLYNLSCAESLLGNQDSALSYLQDSINSGFRNLKHIKNDEDLKNLRELDGFKAILVSLENSGNNCFFNGGDKKKWYCLQHRILNFFKNGSNKDLLNARELLHSQFKISSESDKRQISLYNLACVESLLGNLDEALNFLEKAILEGYRDFEHIQDDADLNNLRSLDRFKFLVGSLIAKESYNLREKFSDLQSEVIHNLPKEKNNSEVEPHLETQQIQSEKENFSENEFEKEVSLLTNMGWIDRKKNISALFNAKGDIVLAIELLLAETI